MKKKFYLVLLYIWMLKENISIVKIMLIFINFFNIKNLIKDLY